MKNLVDIVVVSDVVCPWCWIGKRNLEAALSEWAEQGGQSRVHWQPFQLNPQLPDEGMAREDYLLWKFGRTDTSSIYQRVTQAALQLGLQPDFAGIKRQPNTSRAHALIAAAQSDPRLQDQLLESLFETYFKAHQDIGDPAILQAIAMRCGLNEADFKIAMSDDSIEAAKAQSLDWSERGIGGVPFFIIDERYGLSGAQAASELLMAIKQAHAKNLDGGPHSLTA